MTVWHISQTYQLVMIILCAVFLAIVGTRRENELTKNLFTTGFLVMFQNIGYLMLISSENMKDAIAHGNRLIMMMEGRIILDIRGEEKKKLTVSDLLHKFEEESGEEFANDKAILG